ncbi:MAG: hypothetical protein KF889_01680 [Alphaproteobacteria bacterium]|nr:hypothetical protein [Alphaproteobacteria bacterium]MCW5741618.1 hypothetical protein [Alphaproteobacteria bacterium]
MSQSKLHWFNGTTVYFDVSLEPLEPSVRGRALYFLARRITPGQTYGTFTFAGYQFVFQEKPAGALTLYIVRDILMEDS